MIFGHRMRDYLPTRFEIVVLVMAGLLLGFLMGWATAANAAPPPGADPGSPTARWVQTMKTPEGGSCCSEADCRPTAIRQDGDGSRWAWIGREQYGVGGTDQWEPIPPVVWALTKADGDPPDGRAWVCWWGGKVQCARSAGAS